MFLYNKEKKILQGLHVKQKTTPWNI